MINLKIRFAVYAARRITVRRYVNEWTVND